ncbi:MAG: hypothetical protein HY077_11440 [Elusimicrobia bacterium]|nr:hypothetical protein [Elusimicrobiota bacterium]
MRALAALLLLAAPAGETQSVPSQPIVVGRVAAPAAWKKLRERVAKNPGVRQKITVEGVNYTILSVVSAQAYPGQDCPAGTAPRNAVHFTVPAPAAGAGVYPVRLTAACVVSPDSSAHDLLSVDADSDGVILDITAYDASLNLTTHPTAEPIPVAGDTQTSNLATVLGRLVKHLTEAP